jgi:hypothetical protein
MLKQMALLKKKPGLARADFIRLYEDEHAALIARLLPFFVGYRRNYLVRHEIEMPSARQLAHDVIMEMWFESPDHLARLAARMTEQDVGQRMARDEERLFDRPWMQMFTVDEFVTPAAQLTGVRTVAVCASSRKIMFFLRKRPEVSREALIRHYEERHVPLALTLLRGEREPLLRSYTRNYPVPGSRFRMSHLERAAPDVAFDSVAEIGFWQEQDYRGFLAVPQGGTAKAALGDDAAKVIDPALTLAFAVDEYHSAPP